METRHPNVAKEIQEKHTVGRRDLFKVAAGVAALVGTRAGGSALVRGAAGGAAALVASRAGNALAQGVHSYTLTASEVRWNVGGGNMVNAYAYGVDGQPPTIPGSTLWAREGELLQITVENNLSVPTTVHWHGAHTIPNNMDGVPGVTQDPIAPGGSFLYRFTAPSPGTYVYHTHFDTPNQLPRGLYGLLVVDDPKGGVRSAVRNPQRAAERTYNRQFSLVLGSFPANHANYVPPGDEIQLINGRTFYGLGAVGDQGMQDRLIFNMRGGDRVLFRVFNASNEVHPMHTHGMSYAVVAADAHDLEVPVHRDTLAMNAGERYDIIAHADNPGAWLFHCHNLDHVAEGMIAVNIVT